MQTTVGQQNETVQQQQYVSVADAQTLQQRIAALEGFAAASEQQQQQAASQQQQTPPVRNFPSTKIKEPDVFTGQDPKVDVNDWLHCQRIYMRLAHVSEADKMDHIYLYLKGSALLWWRKLLADNAQAQTWTFEQFAKQLTDRYSSATVIRLARDKINSLKQTGSVSAYNDTFNKLALRIPDMTAAEAMDKYVRGLKADVATWIAVNQPQDLQVAMNMAVEVDRRLWTQAGYRQQQQQQQHGGNGGPEPMELGLMQQHGGRYQYHQRPYQFKGKCYNCGEVGHKAAMCRKPKNKDLPPSRKERRQQHQLNT